LSVSAAPSQPTDATSATGRAGHARMRVPEGVYVSSFVVRVGYVDTDLSHVVHHSTYLRYLEAARVEYMRERGVDYKHFELVDARALPVVEAIVRYKLPARFDDQLVVKTWIALVNRAKVRFDSLIFRGSELLTQAEISLCCVKLPEQRLCSMPQVIAAMGDAR
jgi:acyl-CoA thioester hydrolase